VEEDTRIVLVRHGESVAQQRRIIGGHTGCRGLSDRGRAQVAALRDRLAESGELAGTTALYSSVMARAAETADILAPALDGLDVQRDCVFCESHPGEGDGLDVEEYDRRWPFPASWTTDTRRDPGSESFGEMSERVRRALDTLVERHRGETVVVACHGGVVVHSVLRWFDIDPARQATRAWLNPVNSSITEWRITPHRSWGLPVELVRFNDHAHLRGELAPQQRRRSIAEQSSTAS
jgi:broad specificity phosphatase PhoE